MRKFLYIMLAFLFIFNFAYFCNFSPICASEPIYYRVISDNTVLYKTPVTSEENSNVYFTLPNTYFVIYNSTFDETMINVTYKEFTGYVLIDNLQRVYSTPEHPFETNRTFSVQGIANLVVRSEPNTTSDYLGTIPFNAVDIEYFGQINGEQANSDLSDLWYFCRYKSFEQGIITGYVYAPLTQNLTPFSANVEEVLTEPNQSTNAGVIIAPELQTSTNILLILGLTIPALILLLLVFKPEKRKKKREASRQITSLNRLALPDKNDKNEFDF